MLFSFLDIKENIQICSFAEWKNLQSKRLANHRSDLPRSACSGDCRTRSSWSHVTTTFAFNRRVFYVKITFWKKITKPNVTFFQRYKRKHIFRKNVLKSGGEKKPMAASTLLCNNCVIQSKNMYFWVYSEIIYSYICAIIYSSLFPSFLYINEITAEVPHPYRILKSIENRFLSKFYKESWRTWEQLSDF